MTGIRIVSSFAYQRCGVKHDIEDAVVCDERIGAIAVADGVSRYSYRSDGREQSRRVRATAQLFCHQHVVRASHHSADVALRDLGDTANSAIRLLNSDFGVDVTQDHKTFDPYGTVGIAAIIQDGFLHYGFIGDCCLLVIDTSDTARVLTVDQVAPARRLRQQHADSPPRERADFVPRNLRNDSDVVDNDGNRCGFGVLDGDSRALPFWTTNKISIGERSILLAYSDGAAPLLVRPFPSNVLANCRKNSCLARLQRLIERRAKTLATLLDDDATLVGALLDREP